MRLHLADVHLEAARLARDRGQPAAVQAAYAAACALVEATACHRRDDEIVELAEYLGLAPPPWVGRSDILVDIPVPKLRRRTRTRLEKKKPPR